MISDPKKIYFQALKSLKSKNYPAASGYFKTAEKEFAGNPDFCILKETTELLLAVRKRIIETETGSIKRSG